MATKKRRRRRLRREIRYALYILAGLLIVWGLFSLLNGGKSQYGKEAARYKQKNCIVYYPKGSAYGRQQAQSLCEGVEEKTVFDYALVPYGDYYLVDYGKAAYLVTSDKQDIPELVFGTEGQQILRDYLIYEAKEAHRPEVQQLSFYEENAAYETHGVRDGKLVVSWPDYELEGEIPLAYLQNDLQMNFGYPAQEYQPPHYVDPEGKLLCLTFDDGPSNQYSPQLIAALRKYDARATFFICGYRLTKEAIELTRQSVLLGNEYGSHTQSHPNLTELSNADAVNEIMTPYNDLKNAYGYEMKLMRPPYGAVNKEAIEQTGLTPILWTVDSLDWSLRNGPQIVENVKKEAESEDIILFHDIYDTSIEAAVDLIPYYVEEGYQLVTVSELRAIQAAR